MTQVLVNVLGGRTLCINKDNLSLDSIKDFIYETEGIPLPDQIFYTNSGKEILNDSSFQSLSVPPTPFLSIKLSLRGGLCGGKGGFGSLLRSARSTKKTTDFGSCRDTATGRRIRDIENERKLHEWQEKQRSSKQHKEAQKDAGEGNVGPKRPKKRSQEVDKEIDEERKNTVETVTESVEKGLHRRQMKSQMEKEKKLKQEKIKGIWDDDFSEEEQNKEKEIVENIKIYEEKTEEKYEKKPEETFEEKPNLETESPTNLELKSSTPEPNSSSTTKESPQQLTGVKRPREQEIEIDLNDYTSPKELEKLGLQVLKDELMRLGLKCGGNLPQRAERLWMTKGVDPSKWDPSIKAPPVNNRKKR